MKGIEQEGLEATEPPFRLVVSFALRIGSFIASAHLGETGYPFPNRFKDSQEHGSSVGKGLIEGARVSALHLFSSNYYTALLHSEGED